MQTFIVPLMFTIFLGIISTVFSVIAFIARDKNRKNKMAEIVTKCSSLTKLPKFGKVII